MQEEKVIRRNELVEKPEGNGRRVGGGVVGGWEEESGRKRRKSTLRIKRRR